MLPPTPPSGNKNCSYLLPFGDNDFVNRFVAPEYNGARRQPAPFLCKLFNQMTGQNDRNSPPWMVMHQSGIASKPTVDKNIKWQIPRARVEQPKRIVPPFVMP